MKSLSTTGKLRLAVASLSILLTGAFFIISVQAVQYNNLNLKSQKNIESIKKTYQSEVIVLKDKIDKIEFSEKQKDELLQLVRNGTYKDYLKQATTLGGGSGN